MIDLMYVESAYGVLYLISFNLDVMNIYSPYRVVNPDMFFIYIKYLFLYNRFSECIIDISLH